MRLRGLRVLLLLEPDLAAELLSGHAASTVKGPGLRRARGMLGDGLLTSEGAAHDRARRLVAPAFSPRRLNGYVEIFARCARDAAAGWTDGERRDLHVDMAALTLRAAGHALLGADVSGLAPSVRAGLDTALAEFGAAGPAGFDLGGTGRAGGSKGASDTKAASDRARGKAARATVHRLVDDIIGERRSAPPG